VRSCVLLRSHILLRSNYFELGNSCFQIILCGTMWGLNRFQRPPWSTGILIPASFLCGIIASVFIWRGGQKTKRTKQVEERLRLVLAMDQHHDNLEMRTDGGHPPNGDKVDAYSGTGPAVTDHGPTRRGSSQEKARDYEQMTIHQR